MKPNIFHYKHYTLQSFPVPRKLLHEHAIYLYRSQNSIFALLVHDKKNIERLKLTKLSKENQEHINTLSWPNNTKPMSVDLHTGLVRAISANSNYLKRKDTESGDGRVKRFLKKRTGYGLVISSWQREYGLSKDIWITTFDIIKSPFQKKRELHLPDTWSEAKDYYNITDESIRVKYARRRFFSVLLLLLLAISVSWSFNSKSFSASILSILICVLLFAYYIRAVFEMFQIRAKKIIPLKSFLKFTISQPKYLLPLPYPFKVNSNKARKMK